LSTLSSKIYSPLSPGRSRQETVLTLWFGLLYFIRREQIGREQLQSHLLFRRLAGWNLERCGWERDGYAKIATGFYTPRWPPGFAGMRKAGASAFNDAGVIRRFFQGLAGVEGR
jgi:hypothetical protein